MALIAGAVVGAVTAIYSGVSSMNRAQQAQAASINAMHMRANNAYANSLFAATKKGNMAQFLMQLSNSPAPRGVPPWMSGGPGMA